jgi:hypothetical protein
MVYVPMDIEEAIKRECKRRRYGEGTIKTYICCISHFLKFTGKSLDKPLSEKEVAI